MKHVPVRGPTYIRRHCSQFNLPGFVHPRGKHFGHAVRRRSIVLQKAWIVSNTAVETLCDTYV